MTYFPQPNPANPARRVKVGGSVVVAIRSDGAQPVRAKLHDLSATGGLLLLPKPLGEGDFVEVAFQTSKGTVHGMAELLVAKRESNSGCLQPFRFVAMDDENHNRLRMALASLLDQTMVNVASSNRPRSS
jgi:hypothetical protein